MQSVSTEASAEAIVPGPGPVVGRRAHPALWVPTLYFAEGLPMVTVSVVAAIVYKNLGVKNDDITLFTGYIGLPWMFKFVWSPLTEMYKTKKHWVYGSQLAMGVLLACIAFSLHLPNFLAVTLAFFGATGILSATHDIAADGVYIATTTAKEQAAWVGIQGVCWNGGKVVAQGLLVTLSGYFFKKSGLADDASEALKIAAWQHAWMYIILIIAGAMVALGLWHARILPQDARSSDSPDSFADAMKALWSTVLSFVTKKGFLLMFAFLMLYRSGEGFIEKIAPLFMLDPVAKGGLALTNETLGNINGSVGTIGFMAGALLGGMAASRLTLKRSMIPLAICMNAPHACYLILASLGTPSMTAIYSLVTVEKFGYGFGSVACILYMMQQVSPGKYRTAHYAFANALAYAGYLLPSMASGWIQVHIGYRNFFLFGLLASIPSVIAAGLAPFHVKDDEAPVVSAAAGH